LRNCHNVVVQQWNSNQKSASEIAAQKMM